MKLGFIDKVVSEKDKRETLVSNTSIGESIRTQAVIEATISVDEALRGFSDEEVEELNSFLNRVKDNLINKE
jgi:DNA-binding MarR family transcriptional regulator